MTLHRTAIENRPATLRLGPQTTLEWYENLPNKNNKQRYDIVLILRTANLDSCIRYHNNIMIIWIWKKKFRFFKLIISYYNTLCAYNVPTHKLHTIRRKTKRLRCEGYFCCDFSVFVIINMLKYLLGTLLRYYIPVLYLYIYIPGT